VDRFQVLGLPAAFDVDVAVAEATFRELSRRFHPDRFATADPRARRASLQRSVQLNEAWSTMKDPVRRAEYLLHLHGYEVGAEQGASAPPKTVGGGDERRRIPVPPALLGEILELREELGEARAVGDDMRVQAMAAAVRERSEQALARAAAAIAHAGQSEATRDDDLTTAARELISIRYFRRFLDEVALHDEGAAARAGGSRA
jgi:molecular chaperone HscB